jgi:AAHS family 4-hydroxybenzoate transporter-like MFS transporter
LRKLSGFQTTVLILCFLVVAVDGFDTAAVSYVAPALIAQLLSFGWGLGAVFSMAAVPALMAAIAIVAKGRAETRKNLAASFISIRSEA